ncbi:MAG: hypothetical protein H3C50_01985 [Kiritimatiellae bacterium]|nr:hypothetical protein [Kiritimatiellia bacterium]MCO5067127.1 hypothetical protein [Kiritimatiellia bacterium]
MPILFIAAVVVVGLCALGLSVGLLLRGKSLQTCGRALGPNGESLGCASCGSGGCQTKNKSADDSHKDA